MYDDGDVFGRGNTGLKDAHLVEHSVRKRFAHRVLENTVQGFGSHDLPGLRVDGTGDRDLDPIIVPVPVGIRAFPENPVVLFGPELPRGQDVRRGKVIASGHFDHAGSPWTSTKRSASW